MTEVLIVWPHGPCHFVVDLVDEYPEPKPGWMIVRGVVVQPADAKYRALRSFLVRRTDYGYELMPANRDPIAIWEATGGRV